MSITVLCDCGKSLKARSEDEGKRAKCPHCGAIVIIEAIAVLQEVPASPMPRFQAITLDIGKMTPSGSYLSMQLKVEDNGDAAVMMYVTDMSSRRQGEIIRFRPNEFPEFLALVEKVCASIRHLQGAGKMSKMLSG